MRINKVKLFVMLMVQQLALLGLGFCLMNEYLSLYHQLPFVRQALPAFGAVACLLIWIWMKGVVNAYTNGIRHH